VFFWHLLLLEQMTKEVPGIGPAVIATETGTSLDEYHRFRHVVRNVYTHRLDPAKLGKLVNPKDVIFLWRYGTIRIAHIGKDTRERMPC